MSKLTARKTTDSPWVASLTVLSFVQPRGGWPGDVYIGEEPLTEPGARPCDSSGYCVAVGRSETTVEGCCAGDAPAEGGVRKSEGSASDACSPSTAACRSSGETPPFSTSVAQASTRSLKVGASVCRASNSTNAPRGSMFADRARES